MRKLVSAVLGSVVVVALCIGLVAMGPRPSIGEPIECTWGNVKCCFSQPPCGGCCEKPKDDGVEPNSAWLPTFLRDTLWPAFRVLVA